MPVGQAATTQQLQLEALNDIIKLLIEEESLLDKRISERGSITPVFTPGASRIRFQFSGDFTATVFTVQS